MADETVKDRKEDAIASFQSYTDTSRWRPKMFASAFDEYQRKVGNDVCSIFEFGFKSIKPTSDNFFANMVIMALSPIIMIPILVPFVAIALPVIMIKNFSLSLLPAMTFDICSKVILSAAFAIHHPVSAVRIIIGGIRHLGRRKPENSDSTES